MMEKLGRYLASKSEEVTTLEVKDYLANKYYTCRKGKPKLHPESKTSLLFIDDPYMTYQVAVVSDNLPTLRGRIDNRLGTSKVNKVNVTGNRNLLNYFPNGAKSNEDFYTEVTSKGLEVYSTNIGAMFVVPGELLTTSIVPDKKDKDQFLLEIGNAIGKITDMQNRLRTKE